jgi:maltooligosyltrehalose trehalohydrolase
VLDWQSCDTPEGRKRLTLVRELLVVRRREIAPRLAGAQFGSADVTDDGLLTASWRMNDGATLRLTANLSSSDIVHHATSATGTPIWGGNTGDRLQPWSVTWRIGG